MSGPVANVTGNPYTDFRLYLVDLMYPAPDTGHLTRLNALTALLAVTIALAVAHVGTNVRNSKRETKQVWFVRIVRRPPGRYLIVNQSFSYPLGVIVACSVWLAYLSRTRSWWYGHTSAATSFYWITLCSLPAFVLSYSTTLAYLAASNVLAAHPTTQYHHPLSPQLSNSLFATLPILLIPMYITSIRCGSAFSHVFALWQDLELELAGAAETWTASPVAYGDVMLGLRGREAKVLHAPYRDFVAFHRTSVGVDLGCFAVLLFLNLAGIALLVAVRKPAESQRLRSATATPLPPSPSAEVEMDDLKAQSEHRISIASIITASTLPRAVEGHAKRRTGHRLEWDITLFYFGVAPIAALYVAYGSWVLSAPDLEFGDFGTLEIASFWVPWAYAGISSVSLLATLLKRTLSPAPPQALPPLPSLSEMRASLPGGPRRRSRVARRDSVLDD